MIMDSKESSNNTDEKGDLNMESTKDENETSSTLSPELEMIQLDHVGLKNSIIEKEIHGVKEVYVSLKSGRECNLAEFLLNHLRKMKKKDKSWSMRSLFLQFFGFVTYLFDREKYEKDSAVYNLPSRLHQNQDLNTLIVDVLISQMPRPDSSNHVKLQGMEVTDLCNIFTIIQNYASFEFRLETRHFCQKIIEHPKIIKFIYFSLFLMDCHIDPSSLKVHDANKSEINFDNRDLGMKVNQLKSFFQRHLVEFWNSVVNWNIFPENHYFHLLKNIVNHPKFKSILTHILASIRVNKDMESLFFLKLLVEGPLFTDVFKGNTGEVRDDYLNMTLSMITDMVVIGLDESQDIVLHLMDTFVDLCSDSKFSNYLLKSKIHKTQLLKLIQTITDKHKNFFNINDVSEKHKELVTKAAATLLQLYCCLNDSTGLFIGFLLKECKESYVSSLRDHFVDLKNFPLLKNSKDLDDSDIYDFSNFIKEFNYQDQKAKMEAKYPKKGNKNNNQVNGPSYERIKMNVYVNREPPLISIDDISECNCSKMDLDCSTDVCSNRKSRVECLYKYCKPGCQNQRLQKNKAKPTYKEYSETKGFMLMANDNIKAGELITEYVGEVVDIDDFVADRDRRIRNWKNCFTVKVDGKDVIDANRMGNNSRFVNHSCDPNCEFQRWLVGGTVRVGLFAKNNIPKDCELTVNYCENFFGSDNFVCHCNASDCQVIVKIDRKIKVKKRKSGSKKTPKSNEISKEKLVSQKPKEELYSSNIYNKQAETVRSLPKKVKKKRKYQREILIDDSYDGTSYNDHSFSESRGHTQSTEKKKRFEKYPRNFIHEQNEALVEGKRGMNYQPYFFPMNPYNETYKAINPQNRYILPGYQGKMQSMPPLNAIPTSRIRKKSPLKQFDDAIAIFNKREGFQGRACTHVAIARGIKQHTEWMTNKQERQKNNLSKEESSEKLKVDREMDVKTMNDDSRSSLFQRPPMNQKQQGYMPSQQPMMMQPFYSGVMRTPQQAMMISKPHMAKSTVPSPAGMMSPMVGRPPFPMFPYNMYGYPPAYLSNRMPSHPYPKDMHRKGNRR